MNDSYEILGVNHNATDEQIKKAYKKLARNYHPDNFATASEDKKKQAEEKMKEINAAYDSIKEERSRPKQSPIDDFSFPPDFIDIILGRNRQRQSANNPTRGADLRYNLTLELEEAAFGKEVTIKIPPHLKHSNDEGKGKATRDIKVYIPKGVDNGTRIRVRGGGNASDNGGEPGDLYIYINVNPHKIFKRKGDDIYCEVSISFVQAALGTKIEVPTLDGNVKLDIPAGTQSDTIQKIAGKGIPYLRSDGRGDEYVTIKVVTPQNLSRHQKKLLQQFENETDNTSNFFSHIKNFFNNMRLAID